MHETSNGSINLLGKELGSSAKNNFQNGETLENSASTMTNSMNNLAEKANEQAASLEETAAALEEITSITRNNTQNATDRKSTRLNSSHRSLSRIPSSA